MKKRVLYAVALAGFTIFSSYSMNVSNDDLTGDDLDLIKRNIRQELDSINHSITLGNVAQAQTRLNNQSLIQLVRNYPSFYRRYQSLLSRANPTQNVPATAAARRLNFNAPNNPGRPD